MRRQTGASVLEFLIWLGLAAVVVGSAVVFYQRAQEQAAAFELQRKLNHLVTKVRQGFAGREFYTRDGTPDEALINNAWMLSANGPGLTLDDVRSNEFGAFLLAPSFALGETTAAFRVQSPHFRTNRFVCEELVRFAIVNLEPLQVELASTSTVVWTRGGTVGANDAAQVACAPPSGSRVVAPVRFHFS